MPLKIAVASGKGGTGKTTVAVNLYRYFSEQMAGNVLLVDCDVEEPNDSLFFPGSRHLFSREVTQELPVIDTARCSFCRRCTEYCEFNAIVVIPPVRFASVSDELCHSCGACMVACDQDAIRVKYSPIGIMTHYEAGKGEGILEGTLKIGSVMQTMLIRKLKSAVPPHPDLVLFDAPPGSSCPVVESVSESDYIVLVTEPTPFGLHDLRIMTELVRKLDIPFGVVINKAGTGFLDMYSYLQDQKIDLLAEIPFSREYASNYAEGELFSKVPEPVRIAFSQLAAAISRRCMAV
jgi:MinD superfamily P-loop ATPase